MTGLTLFGILTLPALSAAPAEGPVASRTPAKRLNQPGPDLRHRPQAQHRTRFTEYV